MKLFDGIRVLDLSRMLAGPYGSMLLADHGAEVIKIEDPDGGDPMRVMGPPFLSDGDSAYFLAINRNKKSIVLDLSQPDGRDAFLDLVRRADIVWENFRPGVMAKLGLDYESLARVNPKIIHCAISAYGQEGPHRELPAFDLALQARGGAMSLTGEPGRPPVRMGLPMGDLAGGMFGAFAVAGALLRRERTGRGASLDLALLDCQVSLLTYIAQYYWTDGKTLGPAGSGHTSVMPYGAYATRDGHLIIAVFNNRFWHGFCVAMDRAAWEHDPRFATNQQRVANRAALEPLIVDTFATKPTAEWLERLHREGVPAAPIQRVDQVLADEQVKYRGMIAGLDHPVHGRMPTLGTPIKVDGAMTLDVAPPARLGQHTADVLRDVAGYDAARIDALRSSGVIL